MKRWPDTTAAPAARVALAACMALASAAAVAQPQALTLPYDAGLPPPPPAAAPAPAPRRGMDCLIEPHSVVSVGSPIDGVLEMVTADRGASVRQGQVLAKLQSGVEAAAVELSQARVAFSRRKVERSKTLFDKQLISAQDTDEMVTELHLHEQELARDQELLRQRVIVSPLDGVVVERKLAPGDLVRADKSVVMTLARLDPLHVEVVAPAELWGSIKVGMTGRVGLAPFAAGLRTARVVVVDRLIDAASGTFGVRLELPNPDNRLPAGVRCSVRFDRR